MQMGVENIPPVTLGILGLNVVIFYDLLHIAQPLRVVCLQPVAILVTRPAFFVVI